MKQYPKYKDSKISWIGDVPEHWKYKKINLLFSERCEKHHPNEPILCSTQKFGVIPQSMYENRVVVVNKGFDGLKLVCIGDFVISLRSFQGGIEYAYYRGIISAAYTVLSLKNNIMDANYIRLLFKSHPFIQLLQTCVTGIREGQNINYSLLRKQFLPVPPTDEQQAIVDFLDKAVKKIDRYIAAKEAEIEKLGTLKQSIISQAVTKGLDPNAPMKDSGIDWMGNIPENWEIHSIKQHFCIQKRIAGKEGYNVFSITQKGLKIKDISQNDGQMAANYSGYQFVYPGDFAMNHMDLITGGVGLSTAFGVTSPDYRVFELFDHSNCFSEYYLRIFQVCYWRRIFYRHGRGAASIGRWRLPAKAFLNFQIPVPPKEEQENITKYINIQIEKVDFSIANIRRQIEKLKTYKQRLISDAVTGKIDVRERLG